MQTCDKAAELIPLLIDGMLEGDEKERLESHLKECETCRASYETMSALIETLGGVSQPEPPSGLHELLMENLPLRTTGVKRTLHFKERWRSLPGRRYFTAAAAGLIVMFILLSAAAAGLSVLTRPEAQTEHSGLAETFDLVAGEAANDESIATGFDAGEVSAAATGEAAVPPGSNPLERLAENDGQADNSMFGAANPSATAIGATAIGETAAFRYTFTIHLTVADLRQTISIIEGMNGYTLNADVFDGPGGSAEITRRVDLTTYENAKAMLRGLGKVTNEQENAENLTAQRQDTWARLTAKSEEYNRLLALLSKSGDIEILTKVEYQLSGVTNEHDNLTGQFNALRDESDYPYLVISLSAGASSADPLSKPGFASRVSESFIRSVNSLISFLENALVFAAAAFLPVLIAAAILGGGFLTVRRIKKRKGGKL
ncbi:MAG: DUF4349 domain-containing protein [Clostridiales bacterium]|jgi:predicted anti-sigma-YlaC factor YlaD|nr:DUF4349 domain-containing protein [Clostridiales bacterium]